MEVPNLPVRSCRRFLTSLNFLSGDGSRGQIQEEKEEEKTLNSERGKATERSYRFGELKSTIA